MAQITVHGIETVFVVKIRAQKLVCIKRATETKAFVLAQLIGAQWYWHCSISAAEMQKCWQP